MQCFFLPPQHMVLTQPLCLMYFLAFPNVYLWFYEMCAIPNFVWSTPPEENTPHLGFHVPRFVYNNGMVISIT